MIREKGLDQAEVEEAVAEELAKFEGVAAAVSSIALRTASLPDTRLMRAILKNFHPKRSGDIFVVFEPNVFINDFDGLVVASTHGSPWRYDTFVPVIFAGAGLKAATVSRAITPYDVAPTLANLSRRQAAVGLNREPAGRGRGQLMRSTPAPGMEEKRWGWVSGRPHVGKTLSGFIAGLKIGF